MQYILNKLGRGAEVAKIMLKIQNIFLYFHMYYMLIFKKL